MIKSNYNYSAESPVSVLGLRGLPLAFLDAPPTELAPSFFWFAVIK